MGRDKSWFTVIIKDVNSACYYGPNDNVYNIEGKLSSNVEDVRFNFIDDKSSIIVLNDVPTCELIYRFNGSTFIKHSGLYNINIKEGTKSITSDNFQVQIYIPPGDFYNKSTTLSGNNNITAGDIFTLYFETKDIFGNSPNYYVLVENFEIKLWNIAKNAEIN